MVVIQGDGHGIQPNLSRSEWDPRNFEPLVTLGKGNYATVYLVKSPQTKQLYAMKVRSKKSILANSETQYIDTERTILQQARKEKHPFVVEVFGGFQNHSYIMLYLEFCQGGSLMQHVIAGQKFTVERTRFYAAEVTLALKWFHDRDILYRNLSLDDILIAVDGHIKLTDFVVSKSGVSPENRTNTFCGSAEFMAPEIILDRPYNSSIDWWQLGIITYQMITQQSPFRGATEDDIYDSILASEPPFPADMTIATISFIKCLLSKEPASRLGSGRNGPNRVMAHAFFRELNWDDVYQKRVPAPFVPTFTSYADVSNFDPEFTGLGTPSIVDSDPALSAEEQELFRRFDFSVQ